jgi:acyl carrier protein
MTHEQIVAELLKFVVDNNPVARQRQPLPLDVSLMEIGVLDSFGVIELVSLIEKRWSIKIYDSELTKEKFGGVDKMARLVKEKLDAKPVA